MIEFRLLLLVLVVQAKLVISLDQCENDICTNEILMKYEPTWDSLDKRPLPRWYDDAKVGIFIHWGVYSVPSFGTEWFWTNWQGEKIMPSYVDFMNKNYKPGFTYQDFAHDFTAELFNATEWALLFRDSGAKYVVLTSKHHDGYCLWPSMHSFSWNSQDVGPNRDIIEELSSSIRANTDIKFGLYYSLFEWFNRMYLDDKYYLFTRTNYVDMKMWPELIELVTKYKPEVIWTDGDWESFYTYWKSTKFLAWLYNESPVKETVVTNDRWGIGTTCHHGDFFTCSDRYNPGVLQKHKWENAMTIDKGSWGHRSNIKLQDYMSSEELIEELVSTVSCGGNILVNVGPTKYGTIEPIFEERLRDMGQWLKNNGEAIYSSKPWKYQNDTVTKNVWFTSKDSEDGLSVYVYAIILNYPLDSWFKLHVFERTSTIKSVELLGLPNEEIQWKLETSALAINVPAKHILDMNGLKLAWSFKITISNDKNLHSHDTLNAL